LPTTFSSDSPSNTRGHLPQLVAGFKVWLRKHRGASDPTVELYADRSMRALGADPTGWCPAGVRSYFMDREQVQEWNDREVERAV